MRPIMYNTLLGVCAGIALLLVPRALGLATGRSLPRLARHTAAAPAPPLGVRDGWTATLGVLGVLVTVLAGAMTLTHPLAPARPHVDMLFGGPSFVLGVLLLAAAWYLGRPGDDDRLELARVRAALGPVSWVVAGVGLIMAWCTAAIVRFEAIGGAPKEEPITGLLNGHPWIENGFFALMYAAVAVGCFVFPVAVRGGGQRAWLTLYWSWTLAGAVMALFSAMNFYTHTGMLLNDPAAPAYRF
ncbi:DUF981 family protein [Polymorphospora rubra]|uniref:DUF981 family protein n=1 Tax=Polymorphospora rubra TaxID=338584 RepID=UPI0033C089A4